MVCIGCLKKLNVNVLVLHRTSVIKSRRCLSVEMEAVMGSFCCSCVKSVTFGYPQHLWNSGHLDCEKIFFFLWSIAKAPSYMITTSISSFYSPFLPLWRPVPCSCYSLCVEGGKPLGKKGLCTSNLPTPSPSSVWQSKTTAWKSSKVKHSVTFHPQSWGIACAGCYPWLLTPYHSCHHLSIIL